MPTSGWGRGRWPRRLGTVDNHVAPQGESNHILTAVARQFARAVGAGLGWGIGMGLTLGATGALGGGLRPLVKSAIRAGLAVSERVAAAGAETWEQAQDLYHEVVEERRHPVAAPARAAAEITGVRDSRAVSIPGGG
jgi:hypothetical protein